MTHKNTGELDSFEQQPCEFPCIFHPERKWWFNICLEDPAFDFFGPYRWNLENHLDMADVVILH